VTARTRRRMPWSVVALAVLVPAAALTSMTAGAFDYLGSRPQVRDVARGDTASYAGAHFQLIERRVVTADSTEGRRAAIPAGTELVLATIRVDPGRSGPKDLGSCDAELVQPTAAGDRSWSAGSGSPARYLPPSGTKSICSLSHGPAYRYQAVFLVPRGAGASAELRISVLRSAPEELRLR